MDQKQHLKKSQLNILKIFRNPYVKVKISHQESLCESENQSVVSDSLRPHGLYSPWNSLASPQMPEYQSGYPFPSPGDLPNPGIKSRSPALQVDSFPAERPGKPGIPRRIYRKITYPQHVTIKLLGTKTKRKS